MQIGELNLDKAFLPLIIKALNKYGKIKEASKALEISDKTLQRRIIGYGIVFNNGLYTVKSIQE